MCRGRNIYPLYLEFTLIIGEIIFDLIFLDKRLCSGQKYCWNYSLGYIHLQYFQNQFKHMR